MGPDYVGVQVTFSGSGSVGATVSGSRSYGVLIPWAQNGGIRTFTTTSGGLGVGNGAFGKFGYGNSIGVFAAVHDHGPIDINNFTGASHDVGVNVSQIGIGYSHSAAFTPAERNSLLTTKSSGFSIYSLSYSPKGSYGVGGSVSVTNWGWNFWK